MAKTVSVCLLIGAIFILCGCIEEGRSQKLPDRDKFQLESSPTIEAPTAGEIDLIEQMAANRQAYRVYLQALIDHYKSTGNDLKLGWALTELKKLDSAPQYNYIIEANVAGPKLKATVNIPEADDMYIVAKKLEDDARLINIVISDDKLRLALDKYNMLIKKHPTSDKIDDAAYYAGQIYRHFKDYTIAVLYYQRTYQWDKNTPYSARYRAAVLLDQKLHERDRALELYEQALKLENLSEDSREYAKQRIIVLSGAGEKITEDAK